MSRYSPSESYSHGIECHGPDDYRISWVVDRYCAGSRLRFPARYERWTDRAGAVRFAKKWDLREPEEVA